MWKSVLLELVASGRYATQSELVEELSKQGYDVNQATVSRTLRAKGVRKSNGVYVYKSGGFNGIPVHSMQVTSTGCLAVVKTEPAFAPMLGQTIDDAELSGVLGTVAGDDTVFVALFAPGDADAVRSFLGLPLDN